MKWKQGVAPQTATKFELNFSRPALASAESAGRHFFEPAAYSRSGRKFHYNTPSNFCQAKYCTNIKKLFFPNLCNITT